MTAKRFNYDTVIANSLLSYPRKSDDAVNEMTSLSNLTEELTLYIPTVPEPFPRGRFWWPFL
uniref:Uncharacterized protein n=1 Tax=Oryza barthii TaxID=65489 RepID=A0A0D3GBI6_9ORYZ